MWIRKHWASAGCFVLLATGIALITSRRPAVNEALAEGQKQKEVVTAKTSASGEAEIRKANADYAAALMAGNLDAIMAFWAPDADYIDEGGAMSRGKDKIADLFRKALPDVKGTKVAIRINSLKFLRPEICLEDGTVEKTLPTGTRESNRFAVVWTRAGDKWLISSVRDLPTDIKDLPSMAAAQLQELDWLVGDWVESGDKPGVTLKVRWTTNKAFLRMEYAVKREGAEPVEVTVRVGWDGNNGRIRSWVFDSMGGFAEGYWERDRNRWLVGVSGILPDGGTGGSTNIYEFVDANVFVWRSTEREVDGQPLADSEVKFVRKPSKQ